MRRRVSTRSEILCIEHERTLSVNWTLSFESQLYQLARSSPYYSPAKRKLVIRRCLDASLDMFYRGEEIGFEEFDPGAAAKTKTPRRRRRSLAARAPARLAESSAENTMVKQTTY